MYFEELMCTSSKKSEQEKGTEERCICRWDGVLYVRNFTAEACCKLA